MTKLKSQHTAVANDIPITRMYNGNASAEYYENIVSHIVVMDRSSKIIRTVNGTGPSPGE